MSSVDWAAAAFLGPFFAEAFFDFFVPAAAGVFFRWALWT